MGENTIYDRVAKLENDVASIKKDMQVLLDMHKNKLAKLEIQKVKAGNL